MLWYKWKLISTLASLAVISATIVICFLFFKSGKTNYLRYIPGLLVMDFGLALLLARYLYLIPLHASDYTRWGGVMLVVIGFAMVVMAKRWEKSIGSADVETKRERN